jgi:hypothetical protein
MSPTRLARDATLERDLARDLSAAAIEVPRVRPRLQGSDQAGDEKLNGDVPKERDRALASGQRIAAVAVQSPRRDCDRVIHGASCVDLAVAAGSGNFGGWSGTGKPSQ